MLRAPALALMLLTCACVPRVEPTQPQAWKNCRELCDLGFDRCIEDLASPQATTEETNRCQQRQVQCFAQCSDDAAPTPP